MTQTGQQFRDHMFTHRQDFLSLLRSLVEEETPTDEPAVFEPVFGILQHAFEQAGMDVTRLEGTASAGQLLATPPGFDPDGPIQLVVGHCDTVWERGTLKKMPFSAEGNVVSGPGTYDMKAGLTMMVAAMQAIREAGGDPPVQPVFLITSDEETGSHDSREVISDWARRAERTFVPEPSLGPEGIIKTRKKGMGMFRVTVTGKPSHAGLAPEEGISAILGMAEVVQRLFRLNDHKNGISVNVGVIEGGERSNVIAAECRAEVDVRVLSDEDGERISDKIRNLQPDMVGIGYRAEGGMEHPPVEKNEGNEQLWQMVRRAGREVGLELEEGLSGGASDGNTTSRYCPTVDGLGAVGEGAHAWHEKIYLEETLERAALLALLLMQPSVGTSD